LQLPAPIIGTSECSVLPQRQVLVLQQTFKPARMYCSTRPSDKYHTTHSDSWETQSWFCRARRKHELTAASLKRPDVVLVNASIHGPVVGQHQDSTDSTLAGLVQNKVQTHQHLLIIHTCTMPAVHQQKSAMHAASAVIKNSSNRGLKWATGLNAGVESITWVLLQGVVLQRALIEGPHTQHLEPKGLCRVQNLQDLWPCCRVCSPNHLQSYFSPSVSACIICTTLRPCATAKYKGCTCAKRHDTINGADVRRHVMGKVPYQVVGVGSCKIEGLAGVL